MTNPLTGGFDVVFQTRESVIDSLYRAIHQDGALQHHVVDVQGNRRIDLVINVPSIELVLGTVGDPALRARVRTRVFYASRSVGDAVDVGLQAVADVTVRAKLSFPAGDPAPVATNRNVEIDWGETQLADVAVSGQPLAVQQEVQSTVLSLIKDRGIFRFALGPLADFGINGLGTWVYQPAQGNGISFGLRLGSGPATRNGLGIHFTTQDWAVALSSEFLVGQVVTALRARLGSNLPPPHGTAPLKLGEQVACAIPAPWPFPGCVQQATFSIFLDALTISLTGQGILVTGAVRQTADLWWVPTVSATWSTRLTLWVDATGALQVAYTDPQVQVTEWYAVVANALAGGAIANAVATGIRDALQATSGSQLTSGFTRLLPQVAAMGRMLSVGLELFPTSVEHRVNGVIVHGSLRISSASRSPIADIRVLPGQNPDTVLFNAAESWAPGAEITEYAWSFGDGQQAVQTGGSRAFVVQNTYAPGRYQACLTIKDSLGRSATTCRGVAPGLLELTHVTNGRPWQFCDGQDPTILTFRVEALGAAAPGAVVTVAGQGWQREGWSGLGGLVTMVVDPAQIRQQSFGPVHGAFGVGTARVTAALPGYQTATQTIEMMDCTRHAETVKDGRHRRERILDRLAGYAFLKLLKDSGALERPPIDLDPLAQGALELGRAVDAVTRLEGLFESPAAVISAQEVLGLAGSGAEAATAVRRRLDEMWDRIDQRGEQMEHQFLDGGHPG